MPAPANIYEKDVDFTSLALRYPEFAKKYVLGFPLPLSRPCVTFV